MHNITYSFIKPNNEHTPTCTPHTPALPPSKAERIEYHKKLRREK